MTKARFFLVCLVAMFAFLACTQPAAAQKKSRFKVTRISKAQPAVHSDASADALAAGLYATEQAFVANPLSLGTGTPGAFNSDGTELWPCFGDSTTANVDCPSIGDPSQTFPDNAVAVGGPSYSWPLSACNQNSDTVIACGQIDSWYEDDSGDTTDDLTYLVTVTQVQSGKTVYIADSGVVDFGANPFGGPGENIIIYGDQGFGTIGDATGPNNGNCDADFNYPLPTGANPGEVYVIQANKTCVPPIAGVATITSTTEVATPHYAKKTTATACAPSPAPCYTVTFTKKYSVIEKSLIYLTPAD
jgi:hypothetical protein